MFVSQDRNLRLVKDPKLAQLDPQTGQIHQTPGNAFEFGNGVLRVDRDDSDALEYLRNHDNYGVLFRERTDADGPEVSVLDKILDAALDGDVESLKAIYVSERSGESRQEVLAAAAKAIEKLEGDVPQPPETPAHELTRYRDPSVEVSPDAPVMVSTGTEGPREPTDAEAATVAAAEQPAPEPTGDGIGQPIPPSTPSEPAVPADEGEAAKE